MKNTLLAILSAAILCGCGTITPEQIDRAIDAAENAATNRPPVVVVTNTPPPVVTNAPPVVVPDAPPAITNPPQIGILKSARWNKFPRVDFVAPEIEKWRKTGSKNIVGQLFLNGRKVEWIAAGRQWSTIHNALHAGKYFQPIKSGDKVTISIADLDGKNESNRIELIVP